MCKGCFILNIYIFTSAAPDAGYTKKKTLHCRLTKNDWSYFEVPTIFGCIVRYAGRYIHMWNPRNAPLTNAIFAKKTGRHKYRRNMERTPGSKTREGIRNAHSYRNSGYDYCVHTPTARPKVLHFVHVLVCSAIFRYTNTDVIVTKHSFLR